MSRATPGEGRPLLGSLEDVPSGGPVWLHERRKAAAERVRGTGLPTKKTESFRFTSVKSLADGSFATPSGAVDAAAVAARLGDDGTHRLLVVDGVPRLEGAAPEGVEIRSLAEVLEREPARIEPFLGRLAEPEFFAGLNAALFTDGVVVFVRRNTAVAQPIHLVHVAASGETPAVAYPRVLVVAEPGSEVVLVETVLGRSGASHLSNEVVEVAVQANAKVVHVVVHEAPGYHLVRQAVRVDRDARYEAKSVTLGGGLLRVDLHVMIEGEGAAISLDGVYHVAGHDHVDHHVLVEHRVPRGTSHQRYRGVVDGSGTAVFDGIVIVRPGAGKTEAHQENKNLLLTDTGTVHTKPHLEIETDDVVCSHGATVGSLDADQLFYLRARGIGEDMARAMLTHAFVREILEGIPHEPIRLRLEEAFLRRLPGGEDVRGLS
ncbi:MAG: Fe-S cluster assembly protein SufD [Polyangiales bacterium]